jgi:PAS domain S-box-containing protein
MLRELFISRLFLRFSLAMAGMLALLGITLGVVSVGSVTRFGEFAAGESERALLDQAHDFYRRVTRERAARISTSLRAAETGAALLAERAGRLVGRAGHHALANVNPAETFAPLPGTGLIANTRSSLASAVFWGKPRLAGEDLRVMNALSHLDPLLTRVRGGVLAGRAAWVILKRGMARYSPNIGLAERMPAAGEFDLRTGPCYTATTPENDPEREARWLDVYQDSVGQGLTLTVAAPVHVNDAFEGSAGIDISLEAVARELDAVDDGLGILGGFGILVTDMGQIISLPPAKLSLFGLRKADVAARRPGEVFRHSLLESDNPQVAALAESMTRGMSGAAVLEHDGERYTVFHAPLELTGWGLGLVVPERAALAPVERTRSVLERTTSGIKTTAFGVTVLAILGATLFVLFFQARSLFTPLQRLLEGMRGVAAGDLSRRVSIDRDDELGELGLAFNSMAERLEEGTRTLRITEAKYRSIFENMAEGMFRITPGGVLLGANPALAAMFGYGSAEEMLGPGGRGRLDTLFRNRRELQEVIDDIAREGRVSGRRMRLVRSDGRELVTSLSARAEYDGGGAPLYYSGTITDLTDVVRKEEAERELRAAEAASLAKSQFLANMSHEIRTPLNAVIGAGDMLSRIEAGEDHARLVAILNSSAGMLMGLVEGILDISRIEAGHLKLECAPFDPSELVGSVCSVMGFEARRKGLEFSCTGGGSLPETLWGDQVRLRQVLINVVGNAVKFTRQGRVEFRTTCDTSGDEALLRFEVRDTGVGIPADMVDAVFNKFTQVNPGSSREFGGAGLGLAIAREFVERMGGRVFIESRLGQGTEVTFSVLMGIHAPAGAQAEIPAEAGEPAHGRRPYDPAHPARILLVEDNRSNQELIRLFLKDAYCDLTVGENGLAAVEAFEQGDFDLVLMDIQLPVMDGIEATQAIRAVETGRGRAPVPIIALTANAMAGDRIRCLRAGCTAYLAKPVRRPALLQELGRYLELFAPAAGTAAGRNPSGRIPDGA